jgi:exodeoxyribonuclease VII small subunit
MPNDAKALATQFKELEAITQELDQGELDIELAIEKYETGVKLAKDLKNKLQEMENRIEQIKHSDS